MTVAPPDREASAGGFVRHGPVPDILAAIHDPGVQLALWQRPRPAALDWVDRLSWDEIADIDAVINGPDYRASLGLLLRDAGYPQALPADHLMDAIAALASRFAGVMACQKLRLRLEVIETDACRKFHMDYVQTRLLMPLVGPGTQWIDRSSGENPPVHQLAAGEVAIFKGRLLVNQPAILHRSPPIAGSGQRRLLLVLDPAE